ncbi:MAG: porin [Kiloniellales bacterium]|nr:porin [Kiloniellales bacterium]
MKKVLFGSTALATAGLVAASPALAEGGIKLGLGGYMNNFFGAGDVDQDGNDFSETGMFSDGEVWFTGETTLDNGISFGANIQLESFSSGDQIDENFGYMEGGFGRVQFGSENTAAYLMQFSAPNVGVPLNSGWVTSFVPAPTGFAASFRTPALSTFIDTGNDENTLTYFTPRLFGFQLGLSYQAALAFSGEGKNSPVQADEDTEYRHGISVGLNFVESFGGVDVSVAGGYRRAEAPDDDITVIDPRLGATTNGAAIKTRTIGLDDMQQVSGGINIGFGGLVIGGSVAAEIDGRVTPTTTAFTRTDFGGATLGAARTPAGVFASRITTIAAATYTSSAESSEGWSYDAGISYSTGPWSFGGTYLHGEIEGDVLNGDEDVLDAVEAGVEYAVGPGITTSLSGLYANWDGESGADNYGFAGIAGINFRF